MNQLGGDKIVVVIFVIIAFAILGFLITIFANINNYNNDCEDKGGVVVRGFNGFICIKAEIIDDSN